MHRVGNVTFLNTKYFFTIKAEILARSLANFYRQYADRHMNLKFVRHVNEREQAIRPQIDVSFSCICPVIDHKFHHHIVKVAVDPRGNSRADPQTTLTM